MHWIQQRVENRKVRERTRRYLVRPAGAPAEQYLVMRTIAMGFKHSRLHNLSDPALVPDHYATPSGLSRIATSIGRALAAVPADLGMPHAVALQVIVRGRERTLRVGPRDEIYRIGREAIANACRHAPASRVEVQIEYRPAGLSLSICDNGCGIDRDALILRRDASSGIRKMRQRAQAIGAQIRISSGAALGTQVDLHVPGAVAFDQPTNGGGLRQWMRMTWRFARP